MGWLRFWVVSFASGVRVVKGSVIGMGFNLPAYVEVSRDLLGVFNTVQLYMGRGTGGFLGLVSSSRGNSDALELVMRCGGFDHLLTVIYLAECDNADVTAALWPAEGGLGELDPAYCEAYCKGWATGYMDVIQTLQIEEVLNCKYFVGGYEAKILIAYNHSRSKQCAIYQEYYNAFAEAGYDVTSICESARSRVYVFVVVTRDIKY